MTQKIETSPPNPHRRLWLACATLLITWLILLFALIQSCSDPAPLKKATLFVYPKYQKNRVFDMSTSQYNVRFIFPVLRDIFKQHGYDLATQDIHPMETSDLILVYWPPAPKPPLSKKENAYLWMFESPLALDMPLKPEDARHFRKIFTYKRAIVDHKKYIYLPDPYQFDLVDMHAADPAAKQTLLTIVASNIYWSRPNNYQFRRDVVSWFLNNHPNDILIYGRGWEKLKPNLSPKAQKALQNRYLNYTPNKKQAVSRSRFSLASENIRSPDYVSEKIFDVMNAGSVPVYLGAPNIRDFVPEDCFVDASRFATPADLYAFLKSVDDTAYQNYQNCIRQFVSRKGKDNLYDIHRLAHRIEREIFDSPTLAERIRHWLTPLIQTIRIFGE